MKINSVLLIFVFGLTTKVFSQVQFTAHTITTGAVGAASVYAVDVDGDGDVDVLSASDGDDKISWYENLTITTSVDNNPAVVPIKPFLHHNYPNPFNPETTITYILDKPVAVDLVVYNLLGQKVVTLVNQKQAAGEYQVRWNGIDHSGRQVSSGVYIYRLKAGEFKQDRRMLFLK